MMEARFKLEKTPSTETITFGSYELDIERK